MKKIVKPRKDHEEEKNQIFSVNEPQLDFQKPETSVRQWAITQDFTYAAFKKIADQASFTLKDWSVFLHTSERTLQRYAKENTAFNGLQIERILLFKQMIQKGNDLFGKEAFAVWLNKKHFSLGFQAPRDLLITHDGVQEVIDMLGRIEHGIVA